MKRGVTAEMDSRREHAVCRTLGGRGFLSTRGILVSGCTSGRRDTLVRPLILALIAVCVIISLAVVPAFAGAGSTREKLYTEHRIAEGESLWSIAQEYSSPEYLDSYDHIREIMEINHLTDSDSIHAGAYLVVPYYTE